MQDADAFWEGYVARVRPCRFYSGVGSFKGLPCRRMYTSDGIVTSEFSPYYGERFRGGRHFMRCTAANAAVIKLILLWF